MDFVEIRMQDQQAHMIPFESGYDRRSDVVEPDWEVLEPTLWEQQSTELKGTGVSEGHASTGTTKLADLAGPTEEQEQQQQQPTEGYQPLHDPRNRLSSLVQNARNNKEALQQRSERLKESRMKTRREYGW